MGDHKPPFVIGPAVRAAVEQIDREAYAATAIVGEDARKEILCGAWDGWEGVQAFARHRILTETLAVQRFSRDLEDRRFSSPDDDYQLGRTELVDEILRDLEAQSSLESV